MVVAREANAQQKTNHPTGALDFLRGPRRETLPLLVRLFPPGQASNTCKDTGLIILLECQFFP